MGKTNRGKKFENVVREAFEKVPNVSLDRIHDQTTRYKGSTNICDFIVYREPYEYYIECKSVHGASLPFSNITDAQWNGLLQKSTIQGVFAGVICWWIDKDVTKFIPIEELEDLRTWGFKSVNYQQMAGIKIKGKKKRVFFDYYMGEFLDDLERIYSEV